MSARRDATCSCGASRTRSSNVVTNPNPASAALVIRQFSIVQRDANGTVIGVQNPYAEIDTKTSGGHDNYNALQLGLSRRSSEACRSTRSTRCRAASATRAVRTRPSRSGTRRRRWPTTTTTLGYNAFDVRHTFTLGALYKIPYGQGRAHPATGIADYVLGGWDVGGIVNARSGLPIDVRITRPDIVYVDGAGTVFNNPAVGRSAVINTPNGGASRNVRRPDLVPGVDPFIESGGLVFLNPAAFSTPKPGTYGNLERGSLHGPGFNQFDLVLSKHFPFGAARPQRRVPHRGLQPLRQGEFLQSGGDAAKRAANGRDDRGQQGAARAGVHQRGRRRLWNVHEHRRPNRRAGDRTAGPIRVSSKFLVAAFRRERPTAGRTPGRCCLYRAG